MSIANPVIKASGAVGPSQACYPSKNLVPSQAGPGPTQVHVRPSAVPKPSNPSNPPKPSELKVKGSPAGPYDTAHNRVEDASHHRLYVEEARGVHGDYVGVSVHARYPSSRFLEPPRVDVTRLPGTSPSATSPAGRPHDSEPHKPPHHPSVPGYDMVSIKRCLKLDMLFLYLFCM